MKNKFFILVVLAIIAGILPALVNLVIDLPTAPAFQEIQSDSPEMKAAWKVIGEKCVMCHMDEPALPYYASFPIMGDIVKGHVKSGTQVTDFQTLFERKGKHEVNLAKLEQAVKLNSMPIGVFMLAHWDGALSAAEEKILLKWVRQVRAKRFATGLASSQFADDPVQPLPKQRLALPSVYSDNKSRLGDKLYHDARLSGDNTISCASCHDLAKGGTDQAKFSTGVRNQLGGVNAPTSLNAVYNVLQFWDGRAKDLADQAGGPPLNPVEMDSNWKQITGKLSKDRELTFLYGEVYETYEWSAENITDAIAEFEKGLVTPDSSLDLYLKGDSTAISADAREGYELFKIHSCATCHVGQAMGGQSFEKPVDPKAYYAFRAREPGEADFGRYNVTKNEDDRHKLKVPILRNIALTYPYLHDGSTSDLKTVVALMNAYFVSESNRKTLSVQDAEKIVETLKNNTGKLNGKQL